MPLQTTSGSRFLRAAWNLLFLISSYLYLRSKKIIYFTSFAIIFLFLTQTTNAQSSAILKKLKSGITLTEEEIKTWKATLSSTKAQDEHARRELKSLLPYCEKNNQTFRIHLLKALSDSYYTVGKHNEAIDFTIQAIRLAEDIRDKRSLCSGYDNLGAIYLYMENFPTALKYKNKSLQLSLELKDTLGIAISYNNIGNVFLSLANYDSAAHHYTQAITYFKHLKENKDIAITTGNLASVYFYQGEYHKAATIYQQALDVAMETHDQNITVDILNNLGESLAELKQYKKAEDYLLYGKKLAEEENQLLSLQYIYENLSKIYAQEKNFDKAYDYLEKLRQIRDSITHNEKLHSIAEMQEQYESEKREKEIQLLTQNKMIQELSLSKKEGDIRRHKNIILFIFVCLILIVGFTMLILYAYRKKKQANTILAEKNKIIERSNRTIEMKNQEILSSINYAKKIQSAILPDIQDFESISKDFFVYFKPRDIVSGDFYWTSNTSEFFFYATCDCTGHGVPGAFMSMLGTSLLNEIINEKKVYEPADILDLIRIKIILLLKQQGLSLENKDGMDMSICRIDKKSKELCFANANQQLILIRGEKAFEYELDKQPVGINPKGVSEQFNQASIQLTPGDCIYTFSDGYMDQFGGLKNKRLKYQEFKNLLLEVSSIPMTGQAERLDHFMRDWRGDYDQIDDILVIGVRIS